MFIALIIADLQGWIPHPLPCRHITSQSLKPNIYFGVHQSRALQAKVFEQDLGRPSCPQGCVSPPVSPQQLLTTQQTTETNVWISCRSFPWRACKRKRVWCILNLMTSAAVCSSGWNNNIGFIQQGKKILRQFESCTHAVADVSLWLVNEENFSSCLFLLLSANKSQWKMNKPFRCTVNKALINLAWIYLT